MLLTIQHANFMTELIQRAAFEVIIMPWLGGLRLRNDVCWSKLQDTMEAQCGSAAICFVSFLPDILDSKAEGRNKYLSTLRAIAEKYKRNAYRQAIGRHYCIHLP